MKNSGLRNLTAVLAKIIEIVSYVGLGVLAISSVAILATRKYMTEGEGYEALKTSGLTSEMIEALKDGRIVVFLIFIALLCVLVALIFRNIHNIFKVSNVASPFAPENVKRIRTIGTLAIALPVVKIIGSVITTMVIGSSDLAMEVSLADFVFGLVAFCLAQYFEYGAQLEKDVEGLL